MNRLGKVDSPQNRDLINGRLGVSIEEIDHKVQGLYQLAKTNPDNLHLQEAVALIKTLRRSQGALQSWNGKYRQVNSELTSEMAQISQDNALLQGEIAQLNQEMQGLVYQKERILAERSRVIAELNAIQTEVEVAAIKVRETRSLFRKFSILWTLIKSLFLENDPEGFGRIDSILPADPDKPQMETDQASVNRSLLDR